ncbi:zeta toxin family protein [Gilvimarinus sp. 2_MG-2023]|uniref:zeta toxin family protein n=1 Tax=Gilvimarinus sp. 2_MG-2023 TaxID=3062666 RepID=UPI0026E1733E|nr:zeta toxin family protein [Gilvimarinus sp. 2_MG-2023]MDO6572128.1 zeta toxin family protein [Gilvimarinus sp. 2_MG-2023]
MRLSKEEVAIEAAALAFAKAHKKPIAKRLTDKAVYPSEEEPVSVFMAGSPGAGKTEVSLELLDDLAQGENQVIRIDPDELRNEFTQYDGNNSYLFQKGVSVLVEKIHDLALKQKQSFLLDGTLSNLDKARTNIKRSLGKGRAVHILYVYQDPCLAWEFVKAREQAEGRRILLAHFIEQYFAARENVNCLKREFGKEIAVDLVLKDVNNGRRAYEANIDVVDNHVPEKYTPADLEKLLTI